MLFNSFPFILLFLPTVILVFFALGQREKHRAAIAWLVLVSLVYYGWWKLEYLGLIVGSIFVNFTLGLLLSRYQQNTKKGKPFLVLGVSVNLGLLGWFKYAGFFASNLTAITGHAFDLANIVLPLAISFFTFQQIAYLVDTYRGETHEHSFLHYCLFVTFFPQLIAGPIVHHKEVLPQFADSRLFKPQNQDLAIGLTIFLLGLFEKVVLADRAAPWSTAVFTAAEAGTELSFVEAWCGALAYSYQLFFDFCGYSDMSIGMARMLGIRLPLNFRSPYKALSIIDFWRRWHLTLSRFLRDYLYFPLGGNRGGRVRRYMNLMVTMVLGGLWHGAGWTFVVWGALHGVFLIINHGWRTLRKGRGVDPATVSRGRRLWIRFWPQFLTFSVVVAARVFFRADTFTGATVVLKAMFSFGDTGAGSGLFAFKELNLLILLTIVALGLPSVMEIMDSSPENELQKKGGWRAKLLWKPNLVWAIIVAAAGLMALLDMARSSEFLYYNF